MKSNVCTIEKGGQGLETILAEVEKVAAYNSLPEKETFRLRLLAEELTGMLPELVKNFDGVFWAENNGSEYELHVELSADSMSIETKQSLIEVSTSKKNASATGFMGKIREIAENMILGSDNPELMAAMDNNHYVYEYDMGFQYKFAWTLANYSTQCKKSGNQEEWDRLEMSIVAKLADDVVVGVRGRKVDIIIKKSF